MKYCRDADAGSDTMMAGRHANLGKLIACFFFALYATRSTAYQPDTLESKEVEQEEYHKYCVIGAGPAGLQLGHFLQERNRDYVILERAVQRHVLVHA